MVATRKKSRQPSFERFVDGSPFSSAALVTEAAAKTPKLPKQWK
jgi:hypothetical protein